jgi:hypothetical protein
MKDNKKFKYLHLIGYVHIIGLEIAYPRGDEEMRIPGYRKSACPLTVSGSISLGQRILGILSAQSPGRESPEVQMKGGDNVY